MWKIRGDVARKKSVNADGFTLEVEVQVNVQFFVNAATAENAMYAAEFIAPGIVITEVSIC